MSERTAQALYAVAPPVRRRLWVLGTCWRCDRTGLPVMWLGPVYSEACGTAPFYACDLCVRRLEDLVCGHLGAADRAHL